MNAFAESPHEDAASAAADRAPPAPGPRGLAVPGALLALRRDPVRAFAELRARYGPVVRVPLGLRSFYVIGSADAARRVLCDNARSYGKRTWSYDLLRRVLGAGLITSEGDAWRRQRRSAQPAFHKSALPAVADIALARTDALLAQWRAQGDAARLDLGQDMTALSLDMLARAVLGAELGADAARVSALLTAIFGYIRERTGRLVDFPESWPLPHHARFRADLAALDAVTTRIIEGRRRNPGGHDLVATLLAARDEEGRPLDPSELVDQVKTFLLAGHETTANLLTWTLALLARHPSAAAGVANEVAAVAGTGRIGVEHVARLPFTRAVIAESLRLYPPVWLVERRALAPDVLDGFRIEPGATLAVSQYLLHRDPAEFPEPERFVPERFLSGERPRGYLPFGSGSRTCIGDAFALTQASVVVARIAQASAPGVDPEHGALNLALVDRELPEPEAYVTLRPRGTLRVELRVTAPEDRTASPANRRSRTLP
ncbi:MAG TPA: cytochrome P450 [Polyangiaceae bacterium]|nr:cytochrome P450 [Polyangiaceae bacterium]